MKAKKTYSVEALVNSANERLANSAVGEEGYREGVASMLSEVLQQTGNYVGFRYIYRGSETVEGGWAYDPEADTWNDRTRIQYYKKNLDLKEKVAKMKRDRLQKSA